MVTKWKEEITGEMIFAWMLNVANTELCKISV